MTAAVLNAETRRAQSGESLTRLSNDGGRALAMLRNAYDDPGVPYVVPSIADPDAVMRMLEALDLTGFDLTRTPEESIRVLYRTTGGGE